MSSDKQPRGEKDIESLRGKKIILGITGSIAAYKAAFLLRLLIKAGAEVQVLMTSAAADFIGPVTLATLSKRPVLTDIQSEANWNNHVELGLWADAFIIAPATANTLAKLSSGICDNLLTAVYLSARCPVFVAPAMDVDMWHHPATRRNIRQLQTDGVHLLPVGKGELASGLQGEGRMAEPEEILDLLADFFFAQGKHDPPHSPLRGKRLMLTAGPTYEPLDPVRFLGNRSSGKMGIALADALARRGAEVHLILGPSALRPKESSVEVISVKTAEEMLQAALQLFPKADAAILAAAVADYRPTQISSEKIKKKGEAMTLQLEKTPDIAATLGQQKRPGQYLIGFALETENEKANARSKLQRKNFDFIVLNSLRDPGAGFQTDTNKISILLPDNKARAYELKAKEEVAEDILDTLEELFQNDKAL